MQSFNILLSYRTFSVIIILVVHFEIFFVSSSPWPTQYETEVPSQNINSVSPRSNNQPRIEGGKTDAAITCPPINLPRKGTKLDCILPGTTEDNCQKHQPVGTVAKYSCLPYYEPVGEYKSVSRICRENGRWTGNDDVFSCVSECGVANPPDDGATSMNSSFPGQWPWHAVIFLLKTDGTLQYLCGGTLISRTAILTFGHCVTTTERQFEHSSNVTSNFKPRSPDSLRVYLGKHKRDQMDYQVQLADVDKVIVHPDYNENFFGGSIAVLLLKTEVTNNFFVRPICMTQKSDFVPKHLPTNSTGTVVSFGMTNDRFLTQTPVRIMSSQDILDALKDFELDDTEAKSAPFYAELTHGIDICSKYGGSGMYFSSKNTDGVKKWYLKAIVAGGLTKDKVHCQHIILPKVENYMTWIASTVIENLPKDVNGKGGLTTCPPIVPRTKGIKVECISVLSGISEDNCQKPQSVGTVAKYSCMPFYEPVGGYVTINRKCREDGRWSGGSDIFSCAGDCGVSNEAVVPFITNGKSTSPMQWPWHAALFLRLPNGTFTYICGATLIGRKSVLSAAHCVTEGNSRGGPITRSTNSLRIYLGKHEREQVDDQVQMKLLERIEIYPSYNTNGYDSDIAVLILESEVTLDYFVRPICISQTPDSVLELLQLSAGSIGTVVGFGRTETGQLANEIQMAQLRVMSPLECLESLNNRARGHLQIKSTTFCANFTNGTNVCNGDSGSGMYFPSTNTVGVTKWYLQGLVSVGITSDGVHCDPSQVSIFTRVGKYATWILNVLMENELENVTF